MQKDNLILIGMPAVGKSTLGVVTAKRLGMRFVDTDLLIQEEEGRLLRDIIREEGQAGFLAIEERINAGLDIHRAVIAPGGSVIYSSEAMEHFREIGTIIYLQASFATIRRRIPDPERRGVVFKKGQGLKDLYDERVPYFERYADITVCVDGRTIDETIDQILESVPGDAV